MASGPTSRTPFAYYDPDTCSLRTCQHSLFEDLTESSPTLPRWGSMRSGLLFERPMWVPRTDENASSSLLPTPDAYQGSRGGSQHPDKRRAGNHSVSLQDVVEQKLFPTPSVADTTGGHASRSGDRSNELLLPGVAKSLIPTPTATHHARNATANRSSPKPTTNTTGTTLSDFAWLLSTGASTDPPSDSTSG